MKRLVVIADNPLIVAAIRSGVRESGALELVGYADPRDATAERIAQAGANVVLIDEAGRPEPAIALIRALKERKEHIHVVILTLAMEGEWLQRAFEAGANGAVSKSVHPAALAILTRELVNQHIVHAPARLRSVGAAPVAAADNHSSLTDRELEILRLVASGAPNGVIARQLWITQQTVKFHVSNIYRKLGVANRTEACHYAHVNGIVDACEAAVEQPARVLAIA